MIENVALWSGASGEEYKYYVYEIGTSFQNCPGNYIFAKLTGLGDWFPIYIGKTGHLNSRLSCHDKMPCIKRHGATHVHVHKNSSDVEVRRLEKSDLLAKWPSPCNVK